MGKGKSTFPTTIIKLYNCFSHQHDLTKSPNKQKRLGQKCLTPRNKKKFTKIAFQIFVNFGLFPKELLLLPPFIRF
ncbi:hypothetical protein B7758_12875 [Enterococcus durans]|nr:hypothetical protein B7758_12875 [Enterococcus durans]